MKVEMLETVRHDGQEYATGDVRVIPDPVGEYFCGNGWAKDTSGTFPTAERDVNRKVIAPDNVFHGQQAGEA